MTDQQLLDAGERLYKAFLGSNFTFLELAGLAAARERRTQWIELGQNLKLAVFRLVVLSQPDPASSMAQGDAGEQSRPVSEAPLPASAHAAPSVEPAGESARAGDATETESSPTTADPTDSGDGTDQ